MSEFKKIDHLTEDNIIPGQLFVCISFLSPEGLRNCKVRGLKIRGVYATKEEADRRAKQLQEVDCDFHVFVGEVGKWLPWDPDPDSVSDQVYKEEELQKLMVAYKKNREHANQMERERRNEMIGNARADSKKQEVVNRLRKKLDKNNEKITTQQENTTANPEHIELTDNTENMNNSSGTQNNDNQQNNTEDNSNLDEKLKEIARLYNELHHNKTH